MNPALQLSSVQDVHSALDRSALFPSEFTTILPFEQRDCNNLGLQILIHCASPSRSCVFDGLAPFTAKQASVTHAPGSHPAGANALAVLGDQTQIVFPYPDDAGLSALVICNHAGMCVWKRAPGGGGGRGSGKREVEEESHIRGPRSWGFSVEFSEVCVLGSKVELDVVVRLISATAARKTAGGAKTAVESGGHGLLADWSELARLMRRPVRSSSLAALVCVCLPRSWAPGGLSVDVWVWVACFCSYERANAKVRPPPVRTLAMFPSPAGKDYWFEGSDGGKGVHVPPVMMGEKCTTVPLSHACKDPTCFHRGNVKPCSDAQTCTARQVLLHSGSDTLLAQGRRPAVLDTRTPTRTHALANTSSLACTLAAALARGHSGVSTLWCIERVR